MSAWATDEGEQGIDRIASLRQSRRDSKVIELLSGELRVMPKTCHIKEFGDRRDEAIVSFTIETAARANEVIGLELRDVNLGSDIATIRCGKGGKGRTPRRISP